MRTSQEFKHSGATELVESLPGIPRDERIVTEDPASPSSKQKSREAISGELENDASILLMKKRGGPRTSMGKARSRRNALKHGILSIAVFVEDETRSQYELLSRRLYRDFRPKGMFEEILVEKLVTVIWRYRRLLQAEAAMVQEQIRTAEELKKQKYTPIDDDTDLTMARLSGSYTHLKALAQQTVQRRERDDNKGRHLFQNVLPESPQLESFLRYEANLERALDRTLSQLERAQRIRLGQNVLPEQHVRMTLEP